METRKSTPNYNGSFVGGSQQGGGRRQTYPATSQVTATFQPETRKGLPIRQNQDSSFQPDATFQSETKNFANRQNQNDTSLPEIKKNRQSQDASFQPETRKSIALSRQSAGDPPQHEVRKSMVLNKQNQDSMTQPDMRKSFAANRQSSMQQSSNRSSNINVQPNASYTGELRKSIYQGGGNLPTGSNLQEQDTNQLSGEIYDLHQEGDLSDMTSSLSSSSRSSTGSSPLDESAMPELVSKLSTIDSPNTSDQDDILAPAAPTSAVQQENRKSRLTSINNSKTMEQVSASSNQQGVTSLASRPSAFESSRSLMRSNTTRGNSQSYINFDSNFRGVDDSSSSGRRQSQP